MQKQQIFGYIFSIPMHFEKKEQTSVQPIIVS